MSAPAPVIIGAGPAGAAAAIHLLRAGAEPLLVERRPDGGDALCGGFLSWRTLERLDALGLSPDSLGGHGIDTLRLFTRRRSHALPLPGRAMALSRQRLDGLLLARARGMGARVRHATASFVAGEVRLGGGERLSPDSLFLATGKHDLRGLARPHAGGDPMLGLRLRLRLPPSLRLAALIGHHIEIHLFPGGYLGIVLQEDGSANICMAVAKARLAQAGGSPAALFARLARDSSFLADRLEGMPPDASIDAVGRVPYGWRATEGLAGIFRLGDQAGVIPSIAGEGIGLALASAECAVAHWRAGGAAAAPAYQRAFARRLRPPFLVAGAIAALGRHPAMAALPVALLSATPGAARLVARLTRI